jgi:hypothetical protein
MKNIQFGELKSSVLYHMQMWKYLTWIKQLFLLNYERIKTRFLKLSAWKLVLVHVI